MIDILTIQGQSSVGRFLKYEMMRKTAIIAHVIGSVQQVPMKPNVGIIQTDARIFMESSIQLAKIGILFSPIDCMEVRRQNTSPRAGKNAV